MVQPVHYSGNPNMLPDLHGSGQTLYTGTTTTIDPTPIHLDKPNPTSANNLHSPKLQLPRHPPPNPSTTYPNNMPALIILIHIIIALNPPTTRHKLRNPKTAKAENRSSLSVNFCMPFICLRL